MTEKELQSRVHALEAVCADRLYRHGIYVRIPATLFADSSQTRSYPIPAIAFHQFENGKMKLLREAHQPFLPKVDQQDLWVREQDLPIVRQFAEDLLLAEKGSLQALPAQKRVEILRRSALMVVEDLFENPSTENLDRGTKMVGSFVHLLTKDPRAFFMLVNLSSHDPYTLQHSVGTAVNAIILAKKIGINNSRELLDVGLSGLLHDIGKTQIAKEIINKEGPLDEAEWQEMRKHPTHGYEIVKNNPNISGTTKRAILEHHEDKNGAGYPNHLKQEQISLYSSIVSICDAFNALTTNRSYSKARKPFEAFELIRSKMDHKFDMELFTQLVRIYGGKVE